MVLTGAEKTRRYREKLKRERPQEYAAQCKKNLERIKSKKKKISEMTPEEVEIQREIWRKEKRKSNSKKKTQKNNIPNEQAKSSTDSKIEQNKITALRRRCRFLANKYRNSVDQVKKINTQKESYKKRLQRLQEKVERKMQESEKKIQKSEKKIKELEGTILKLQAREEILEFTLKKTYKSSKTRTERTCLKTIVHNSSNKRYISKLLGLKSSVRNKKKTKIMRNMKEIVDFYTKDDVSRNTAGIRQTKTLKNEKKQIRFLLDTFQNLYTKYRKEGGRYGFPTFYKYKPFNVVAPKLNNRDTCLCIKHENIKEQNMGLKKAGVLKTGVKDGIAEISCDTKNYECMYNKCKACKTQKPQYETLTDIETVDRLYVTWYQWERLDHTYIKKEGCEIREVTTKKTAKVKKTGTVKELRTTYENNLQEFKNHHFNMEHQQEQYQKVVKELKKDEVVIVCDFSQNYEAKLGQEIQAMHFGASKNQITLHTGMIYWHDDCQSFCTIAEANDHKPAAIWAHLEPILNLVKQKTPGFTVIHFYSDGPSSQYRQKNNFYLLAHFTKKYQFRYCTWSFYESGHGKSVADGIGGSVKRTLDKKVCQGVDVADAMDAYNVLKVSLKRTKVFLIPDSKIAEVDASLPNNVQALKGTLRVHQIFTDDDEYTIHYRDVSCFCGPIRGKCDCFSPQTHCVVTAKPRRQLTSTIGATISSENLIIPFEQTTPMSEKLSLPPNKPNLSIENAKNYGFTDIEPDGLKPPKILVESESNTLNAALDFFPESFNDADLEYIKRVSIGTDICSPTVDDLMNIDVLPIVLLQDKTKTVEVDKICASEPLCTRTDNIENTSKDLKREPLSKKMINQAKNKIFKSSRFLECNKCKCSILGRKCKCMACKKWYCEECIDQPIQIDYICDICYEG